MGWRQITSAKEACNLLKDTKVKLLVGGNEECFGKVARDYSSGGLVYFQPDNPILSTRFAGWINPQRLQVQA